LSCDFDWSASDSLSYIKNLNRGGLKFPTQYSLYIGETAYKIFTIVTSEKFETMFINLQKKKEMLQTLVLEHFHDFNMEIRCKCGRSLLNLTTKSILIWCNILLNNYTKVKTNAIGRTCNKRKLSTLAQ